VNKSPRKLAAARNSRRLYEKLRRCGLKKVSLWVCPENEPLIHRLRALDLRRPITSEAMRRALGGKRSGKTPLPETVQTVLEFGAGG
jgi:hypothetical protein